MQPDRPNLAASGHDHRRRQVLLLALVALVAGVAIVGLVLIGTDGDGATDGNGTTPTTAGSGPGSADPTLPPPADESTTTDASPPTTTEPPPPTTTTTTEPPPPTTTTTEPPPPTTTTTEPPPPTTTTTTEPPPPPPVALLTPTGIPVTVIEVTENGFVVETPCGNTTEIAGGERIEPVRVVLDPGHGGPFESGAVGPTGLVERDLNLNLADAVLAELTARGISAATTRTADYGQYLSVRADFADALGAEVLVSIHHNGPTWDLQDTPGTEVFVQSDSPEEPRADSARLGGLLYEEITAALGTFEGVQWSGLPDAGVLRVLRLSEDAGDAYGMLSRPVTAAALVEYGYISNPSEAELFATEEYIAVAAQATADALEAYLETDRPGTGFVEVPRRFSPAGAPVECAEPPLEEPPPDDELPPEQEPPPDDEPPPEDEPPLDDEPPPEDEPPPDDELPPEQEPPNGDEADGAEASGQEGAE